MQRETDPRTSAEAKQHAREILEADNYQYDRPEGVSEDEHQKRVNAGYKAALNSESASYRIDLGMAIAVLTSGIADPRVSEEAKQHAREYLQEHGGL